MSIILVLLTQVALSTTQIAAMKADREAFEPFRQCVLTKARELYPTGNNFVQIFEKARTSCEDIAVEVTIELAANAAERAMDAEINKKHDASYSLDLMTMFSNDLLFEIAKDFVPKDGK